MFITHYNGEFFNCSNSQFDMLLLYSKSISKIYDKIIYEHDILDILYRNDNVFYSSKFLFESIRELRLLKVNYCCLAKLLFELEYPEEKGVELDSIASVMAMEDIPFELDYYIDYY